VPIQSGVVFRWGWTGRENLRVCESISTCRFSHSLVTWVHISFRCCTHAGLKYIRREGLRVSMSNLCGNTLRLHIYTLGTQNTCRKGSRTLTKSSMTRGALSPGMLATTSAHPSQQRKYNHACPMGEKAPRKCGSSVLRGNTAVRVGEGWGYCITLFVLREAEVVGQQFITMVERAEIPH